MVDRRILQIPRIDRSILQTEIPRIDRSVLEWEDGVCTVHNHRCWRSRSTGCSNHDDHDVDNVDDGDDGGQMAAQT